MARTNTGLREAFGALAYGDYRRFAASLLLTSVGAQLVQTAIFWQIYQLTGSALQLGLTGLARAVPHMVLSLAGGVIADRSNRVRLIQAGQIGNGGLVIALALLTMSGDVQVWHLYVVTFLNAAFTALTQPARTALIPMLIPHEKLVNGVALNATIQQGAQIAGPALAGILIGDLSLQASYGLNAAVYLLATLAIIGIRTPVTPPPTRENPWTSLVEGLTFVKSRPVIISLLTLDLGATVFGSYRALLPIFAERLGVGAQGFGWLSAAPGVGSLLGAAGMMSLGNMRYKGLYTIFGVLAYCVALAILPLAPWYWLALVASGLLGVTNAVQMVPRNTTILTVSPNALRGRVEAFRSMLAGGGPSVGFMLSGALAAALGPVIAVVGGAVACAALVVSVGATRRELHDPELGQVPVQDVVPVVLPAPAEAATATKT
ncbi:MAG: MFS transporter [Dehalococcoidia bacterium]